MVTFAVPGRPVPQGSLTSFRHASTGAVVTPQKPDVVEWRNRVAWAARAAQVPLVAKPDAVKVDATFVFCRPRSHVRKGGLAPSAPIRHTVRPDVDKTLRALLDALTGVAYEDDAQVEEVTVRKMWHPWETFTRITVTEVGG